jgi:hypothetical protein
MTISDSKSKSETKTIGLYRLIEELGLVVVPPAVRSEAICGARKTRIADGMVLEQFPLAYGPTDLFGHLRFAMRYEPIDLNVPVAFFEKVGRDDFETWVKSEPVGKYARRAWYLYEFLTGETLDIPDVPPTATSRHSVKTKIDSPKLSFYWPVSMGVMATGVSRRYCSERAGKWARIESNASGVAKG